MLGRGISDTDVWFQKQRQEEKTDHAHQIPFKPLLTPGFKWSNSGVIEEKGKNNALFHTTKGILGIVLSLPLDIFVGEDMTYPSFTVPTFFSSKLA